MAGTLLSCGFLLSYFVLRAFVALLRLCERHQQAKHKDAAKGGARNSRKINLQIKKAFHAVGASIYGDRSEISLQRLSRPAHAAASTRCTQQLKLV